MTFVNLVYYGFCFVGLVGLVVGVIMLSQLSRNVFLGNSFISLKAFGPAVFLAVSLLWFSSFSFTKYVAAVILASVSYGWLVAVRG